MAPAKKKAKTVKDTDYAALEKELPSPMTALPEDDPELDDGASHSTLRTDATIETIPSDETDGSDVDPASFDDDEALIEALEAQDRSKDKRTGKERSWDGGYNALKTYKGQVYTGMAIGGSHTWNYDPGVWKETKKEPDMWEIDYEVTKHRARKAPVGSGAPVGTAYHWLIIAHQYVEKVDANTYTTHLVGSKYKVAHKGAKSNSWSISKVKGQRDREIELLEDAKRRVLNLPPVLASEKVKVVKQIKGQQTLDSLFKASPKKNGGGTGSKRKAEEDA